VVVREVPKPPPTCPTIIIDVGSVFAVVLPTGVNERLFVSSISRSFPAGTVITTGDHAEFGFSARHVAPELTTGAPQV
jgi:hypothetical protein